ncbi:hypothetical protein GCM10025787_36080 [Saccharopolyspora rosea]
MPTVVKACTKVARSVRHSSPDAGATVVALVLMAEVIAKTSTEERKWRIPEENEGPRVGSDRLGGPPVRYERRPCRIVS